MAPNHTLWEEPPHTLARPATGRRGCPAHRGGRLKRGPPVRSSASGPCNRIIRLVRHRRREVDAASQRTGGH